MGLGDRCQGFGVGCQCAVAPLLWRILSCVRFVPLCCQHPGARGGRLFVRKTGPVAQIPEVGVITVTAQVVPYGVPPSWRRQRVPGRWRLSRGSPVSIASPMRKVISSRKARPCSRSIPSPSRRNWRRQWGRARRTEGAPGDSEGESGAREAAGRAECAVAGRPGPCHRRFRGGHGQRSPASAKVREAELNLGYTTIPGAAERCREPFPAARGAYVGASADTAKLTYVAALDPIWVTFSVSQNQVARLGEMVAKKLLAVPSNEHLRSNWSCRMADPSRIAAASIFPIPVQQGNRYLHDPGIGAESRPGTRPACS